LIKINIGLDSTLLCFVACFSGHRSDSAANLNKTNRIPGDQNWCFFERGKLGECKKGANFLGQ